MKKSSIITILIVLAALGGIFYILNKNKEKSTAETKIVSQKSNQISVRTAIADYNEVNAQYIANGTFMPKQEVMLSAEMPGRVTRVLVEEGSYVKAGQTLAIIDGDKQNVGVANAQAVYNNAKIELARFEGAYASGGVTKQQLDGVKLQLENARNNLKNAQLTASDVNIRASFAGVVNKRNIEPGSYVAPGQPLFEIVNVSTLKLSINVDEKNVSQLKLGQSVQVMSNVIPDKTFDGKLTFIAPKADASLNFPVELEIRNNANNELKAGMYGTATIGNAQSTSMLVIPRNAFVGSVSSNQVFVVKDGKAKLTTVVSGRTFGDQVEIISGINRGDEVVTNGQINLTDGVAVEVIK